MIAHRHATGALDAHLVSPPLLIFRGVNGMLEPWDPRVHQEPWTQPIALPAGGGCEEELEWMTS